MRRSPFESVFLDNVFDIIHKYLEFVCLFLEGIMKLFGRFEAVKFVEENLIFIANDG